MGIRLEMTDVAQQELNLLAVQVTSSMGLMFEYVGKMESGVDNNQRVNVSGIVLCT